MPPLATASLPGAPMPISDDRPVNDAEFAAAMARLGAFERSPHLAIGVSGGADSLALTILADRWVRRQGGRATALVVDHGLRAESAAEAATVRGWLAARGIDCRVLRWEGPKPSTAIQAGAREARHRLLSAWCRDAGVLHLLLAHHLGDQRETVLLRLERKSGPDGLAGMSAVVEREALRILRPLLDVAPARLRAMLRAEGQPWIDDPSNANPAFARTRVRERLRRSPGAAAAGGGRCYDVERQRAEVAVAELLGASVAAHPEGWATLDLTPWRDGDPDILRRALARLALAFGGGAYAPRGERLAGLLTALLEGALHGGRTLGGCRFLPRRGRVLVVREPAAATQRLAVAGPGRFLWDGRFTVRVGGSGSWPPEGYVLARLGSDGWRAVAAAAPAVRDVPIPPAARPALPALFDLEGVLAVPHLTYRRRGVYPDSVMRVSATFCPRHALAGPGFAVI